MPELRKAGIAIDVRPMPLFQFRFARGYDAVLLHRTPPGRLGLKSLRKHARRIVFDFDEPTFLFRHPRGVITARPELARLSRVVRAADNVIAANPYLAAYARRYTDDWRVKSLPEPADLTAWPRKERTLSKDRIVLGWMGTSDRFPETRMVSRALHRLTDLFPGLTFRAVSDFTPPIPGVRVEQVPLDRGRHVKEIDRFDIALLAYPDDALSNASVPPELPHYLAAGLPIVAMEMVCTSTILKDHYNALIVQDPGEWERKLGLLLETAGLARALGRHARLSAERIHAPDRVARGYASILKSLPSLPAR